MTRLPTDNSTSAERSEEESSKEEQRHEEEERSPELSSDVSHGVTSAGARRNQRHSLGSAKMPRFHCRCVACNARCIDVNANALQLPLYLVFLSPWRSAPTATIEDIKNDDHLTIKLNGKRQSFESIRQLTIAVSKLAHTAKPSSFWFSHWCVHTSDSWTAGGR